MQNPSRGFTLIELLVVVAIIGMLSVAITTILSSTRVSSRDAKRLADLKELQTALQFYYDKNTTFPETLTDLVTGGQMPIMPLDPRTGDQYFYELDGGGSSYHLATNLEDRKNKALKSDRDSVTNDINGGDGTPSQPSDCGGGSSSGLSCYDVVP